MKKLTLFAAACVLAGAACSEGPTGGDGSFQRQPGDAELTLTRIQHFPAIHSDYEAPETGVIRGSGDWAEFWERVEGGTHAPERPYVNFNEEMVVFTAMGKRPTGGHTATVDSAFQSAGAVLVYVTHTSLARECPRNLVITHPVDAARVPAIDLPVRFQVTEKVRPCLGPTQP